MKFYTNNNPTATDRPRQQNRRFMEANTFLTSSFYSRTDFNHFALNANKSDVGILSKVSLHNVDFLPI